MTGHLREYVQIALETGAWLQLKAAGDYNPNQHPVALSLNG